MNGKAKVVVARSAWLGGFRWFALLTAVWVILTVPLVAFGAWLGILGMLVWPAWALVTLLLILAHVIPGVRGDLRLLLRGLGMACLAGLMILTPLADSVGTTVRFLIEQQSYNALVRSYLATQRFERPAAQYVRVDVGPPARLLFVWDQLGDNGNGVVWDPSGIVATAKGWSARSGDYTADPVAQELFGGDIVSCMHLLDHYYHCRYT